MANAIIFDIDGTLIDSVDLHARAWQETLRRYGCEASFQEVRDQIGKGGDQLLAVFLSPDQIERQGKQIEKERGELFKRDYLPQVKPFPGLPELFERLTSDGVRIALASSAKSDELAIYKRITGIEPFLEAETSADDVEKSKPEPDIFLAALDRLANIDLHDVIAVGDTPYDAEAAGKAGLQTIGVLCGGFAPEKLLAAGCIALYRDPADLLEKYDSSPLNSKKLTLSDRIQLRAYDLWEARGRPWGSPDTDWFNAEQELTAIKPVHVLSKVAREIGSAIGNAVALLSDLKPTKDKHS